MVIIHWEAISGVTREGTGVGVAVGMGVEVGIWAGDSGAGEDADGPQAASKSTAAKRSVPARGFNCLLEGSWG